LLTIPLTQLRLLRLRRLRDLRRFLCCLLCRWIRIFGCVWREDVRCQRRFVRRRQWYEQGFFRCWLRLVGYRFGLC
jgi:hypothetical protein